MKVGFFLLLVILPAIITLDTVESQAAKAVENLSREQRDQQQQRVQNIKQQLHKENKCHQKICIEWTRQTYNRCKDAYDNSGEKLKTDTTCILHMEGERRTCMGCFCAQLESQGKDLDICH